MIDFKNGNIRSFKLKLDKNAREKDIELLLVSGEEVLSSYTGGRDYVVFTNKRIIAVNVQGISGKKKDYTSLPYANIIAFSVETAGTIDIDSELELYFSSIGCVKFEFSDRTDIVRIGQAIGKYVLK